MTDRLPPVVQIAREPNLWQRIRRRVGLVLCAAGVHERIPRRRWNGNLYQPGFVTEPQCARCGVPL